MKRGFPSEPPVRASLVWWRRGAQSIVDSLYWPLSHLYNPRDSARRMILTHKWGLSLYMSVWIRTALDLLEHVGRILEMGMGLPRKPTR